jgi:hypothetical protein
MELEQFEYHIRKLSNHFGRKMSDEQIDIWFGKCGNLPEAHFRGAIEEIIDEERSFPTPSIVKKQAAFFREKNPQAEDLKKVDCGECKTSGWVSARKKLDGRFYTYAFRCLCQNGQRLSAKAQSWSESFKTNGFERLY